MRFLAVGWKTDNPVTVETFYYGSCRHSDVYHFVLRNRDESIELPIVANPVVFRVIAAYRLTIVRSLTCHNVGEIASTPLTVG